MERDGSEGDGALENGCSIEADVEGIRINKSCGERSGGVGADGSAGDGAKRRRLEILVVDCGGRDATWVRSHVAERVAQPFV